MAEILNWIMDSIRTYGPWSVFIGVIIESVIVPIPSPLVIMGAGFILVTPGISSIDAVVPVLLLIVLPGSVASTLGAYIGYGIGFWGGRPLIERWHRFLGFGWDEVSVMEQRFSSGRVNASLFFLRALPIFPLSLISFAAGILRLPLKQFTLWTFYGSVPRCLFLGYLGWWIGETYHHVAFGINKAETIFSAVIILTICACIFWIRKKVQSGIFKRP